MAKKKGITQGQDAGDPRAYGSFLARVAAGHFRTLPEPAPPAPDLKVAWQSVSLPKKVSSLQETVASLKCELAAMKREKTPVRKHGLWDFVLEAKKRNPTKISDQLFIARYVDKLFLKYGRRLGSVCPPSWRMVPGFPDTLEKALQHPVLKGRVKTFISKVRVS